MAPAQSVETQLGVLSEKVVALTETVERRFDELTKTIRDVQAKQQTRDTQCAGERERNAEMGRQVAELWKRVETSDECKVCKQTERLAKMELSLGILAKVSWLLAGSTVSLLVKIAWDVIRHAG